MSFDSRTWRLASVRRLTRPTTERGVYVFDVSPSRAVLLQNGVDLQLRASGRCWTLLSGAEPSWARFTDHLRLAFLLPVARLRDEPLVIDMLGVDWRDVG